MMINPRLALIPSAYKASKIYSVLPANGDGDFAFARSTNATRINKDGLIEEVGINIPRLDYKNGNCPELLLERQRSNRIIQSQDLTTSWSVFNGGSISSNQAIAPNGKLEADELITDGEAFSYVKQDVTLPSTGAYTFTIFAKKGTSDELWLRLQYGTTIYNRKFNLTTETISDGFDNIANRPDEESIEDYGNGWYRLRISANADTTSLETRIYIADATSVSGNSVYLFGAQAEQEASPTSYIPTETSVVTRTADLVTDNSNIDLTSPKFVLYTELNMEGNLQESTRMSINNGDDDKIIRLSTFLDGIIVTQHIGGSVVGGSQFNILYNTYGRVLKIAVASTDLGYNIYVNGVLAASQTQGLIDTSSYTHIGFTDGDADNFAGRVKDLRYYDEKLTEAELIELTS